MRRAPGLRHLLSHGREIEIDGLRKRFGPVQALDGMTFTVHPGQVTGFVGPNGAGKSTTMRVVVGLDAPDAGTATIGGRPYRTLRNPLRHVGTLLDAGALQPSRSARNHLLWLAHSQGIKAGRVDEVIALAGLGSAARRKAGGYSLGMRQRLGIAAALLGDPAVLIFDEPFNGMDPEGIVWMKGFLRSLAAQGRAVLVSSHLMSELQALLTDGGAGHLVVVGRGRVIADTSVTELIATASGNRITLRTTAPAEAVTAPRRGRLLAAKAVVIGAAGFVAGLVGAALALAVGTPLLLRAGPLQWPVSLLTEARMVVGTAALLAVAAVLALAIGTIVRRSAPAVAIVIVVIFVPWLLAFGPLAGQGGGAGGWELQVTPLAALSVQQAVPQFHQLITIYSLDNGYYPLAPWAGLAVECAWAAAALALAFFLLRRRDA